MKHFSIALATFVCLAVSALAPAAPAPQPSPEAAQADFAARDYPACLRKVASLLSSNTVPAGSTQRYDLFMLRGECLLRLKQRPAAQSAFESAAGVLKNKGDVDRVAAATAIAALIKKSPGLTYKSAAGSQGDPQTFDIVEPDTRKAAMSALYHDLSEDVMPAASKALEGDSLVPINDLLPKMWELYAVEFAATGDTAATVGKLKELGAHARGLIQAELDKLNGRLGQLRALAEEPTLSGDVRNQSIGYRGLNSHERSELQEMADYLVKIERTCQNARRIARLLGSTGENWDALLADCATARDVAEQAYARRY